MGAEVKALPFLLFHTKEHVIIDHIGGDPYWIGHLLMPYTLTREGPWDHSSAPSAWGVELLRTLWVSTPTPFPGEVLDTEGDALGSSARISCAARAAPCTGQQTKGHSLWKGTASVVQWNAWTTGVRVNWSHWENYSIEVGRSRMREKWLNWLKMGLSEELSCRKSFMEISRMYIISHK